jgi:hypothetical protein
MTPTVEMVRAHKEVVLSAVKRGEADRAYAFLGGGGFSIQYANSAEELNQRLLARSLASFMNSTRQPSLITASSWTPWLKSSKSRSTRSKIRRAAQPLAHVRRGPSAAIARATVMRGVRDRVVMTPPRVARFGAQAIGPFRS